MSVTGLGDDDLFGSDDEVSERISEPSEGERERANPRPFQKEEGLEDSADSSPREIRKNNIGQITEEDNWNENGDDVQSKGPEKSKSGSQNDLDDLFGDREVLEDDVNNKPSLVRSRFGLPERIVLPPGVERAYVKLPKFVKIQTSCYDENERSENAALIQWRYKKDANGRILRDSEGKPMMESNSRLLRLSNGEHRLVVGGMVFRVQMHPVENSFAYVVHKTIVETGENESVGVDADRMDGEVIGKAASILECAGGVEQRMVVQQESIRSATHEILSKTVKTKYSIDKKREVQQMVEGGLTTNPEKLSEAKAKEIMSENRKARKRNSLETSGRDSYITTYRRPTMSSSYLDQDQYDYDSTSINALKSSRRQPVPPSRPRNNNSRRVDAYRKKDDDEDEDGAGDRRSRRRREEEEMGDFIVHDGESDDYGDEDDESDEDGASEDDEKAEKRQAARAARASKADKDYVPDEADDDGDGIDFGSSESEADSEESDDFDDEDSEDDEDDAEDDYEDEGDEGGRSKRTKKVKGGKKKTKSPKGKAAGDKDSKTKPSKTIKQDTNRNTISEVRSDSAPTRATPANEDTADMETAQGEGLEDEDDVVPRAKRPRRTVVVDSDED